MGMRNIILFTGGKDSLCCLHKLRKEENLLLYFDYGNPAAEKEIDALLYYSDKYKTSFRVEDCFVRENKNELPYRNIIFVSHALNLAATEGYDTVVLGAVRDSEMKDGNSVVMTEFRNFVKKQGNVKLQFPLERFGNSNKIFEYLADNKVDLSHLIYCMSEKGKGNCGKCFKCKDTEKILSTCTHTTQEYVRNRRIGK